MIELKTINVFIKRAKETITNNNKKLTKLKSLLLSLKKQKKNHKLDLKDKTENNKNLNKTTKEKNEKLKAKGLNQNILYIQIRN
jgi:predicted  nucleic acid-binding Zn-ribbon protein